MSLPTGFHSDAERNAWIKARWDKGAALKHIELELCHLGPGLNTRVLLQLLEEAGIPRARVIEEEAHRQYSVEASDDLHELAILNDKLRYLRERAIANDSPMKVSVAIKATMV